MDDQQVKARKGIGRLRLLFTEKKVDALRSLTGYNPRKRKATAYRLMLAVIEACLGGQTLGFTVIRAFFVRRFGKIRSRAFQLRFKQADLGRSAAADRNALDALTYGAMLSHALVRSLRVATTLQSQIPLEPLRPLACRGPRNASDIVDAMQFGRATWNAVLPNVLRDLIYAAREQGPSRSRPRIALELGAGGG
jgi:hypothetical protein